MALADIVKVLLSCYQGLGLSDEYGAVLDHIKGYIADERWQNKIAYLRSLWWLTTKSDRKMARDCIANVRIADCEDIELLALYLDVSGEELSFDQKDKLLEKIIAGTDKNDICFQYKCVRGFVRIGICEIDEGISLVESAVDQFRMIEEGDRTLYGKHLFAQSLQHLGILKQDDALIRESLKAYSALIAGADESHLSDYAIADYLCELGKCHDLLGDQNTAIDCFDKSANKYAIPLAQIYLASAYTHKGDRDSARQVLHAIERDKLTGVNRQDFALTCATLAAETCKQEDIDVAITELKLATPEEPYFINMKNECLVALLETTPSVQRGKLSALLQKVRRYVILQPNFFGIGFNVNNILDDIDTEVE